MRVAIVGAGVAGLACADRLKSAGLSSKLFDKGRRPGGRASTLTLDDLAWDFGAQYFAARSSRFSQQVARWQADGLAARWPSAADNALVGVPSMAAILAAQADKLDVQFGAQVQAIGRVGRQWHLTGQGVTDGPFDAVVIAVPAEQAAALIGLHDLHMAKEAAMVRSVPCWALMAAFPSRLEALPDVLRPTGAIAWASRNNSKPGRPARECWVVQADGDWSANNLERSQDEIADELLGHFAALSNHPMSEPTFLKAHRWRFALPRGGHGEPIWNPLLKLGACGDWCSAPRIEAAWLSGVELADRLVSTMTRQEPATASAA